MVSCVCYGIKQGYLYIQAPWEQSSAQCHIFFIFLPWASVTPGNQPCCSIEQPSWSKEYFPANFFKSALKPSVFQAARSYTLQNIGHKAAIRMCMVQNNSEPREISREPVTLVEQAMAVLWRVIYIIYKDWTIIRLRKYQFKNYTYKRKLYCAYHPSKSHTCTLHVASLFMDTKRAWKKAFYFDIPIGCSILTAWSNIQLTKSLPAEW